MKCCDCGCGNIVKLASNTNSAFGHIKNQPLRFIRGHALKGKKGVLSPLWKGGLWNNKEYKNAKLKEWRHKLGINKCYCIERGTMSIKNKRKLYKQRRRARAGGPLSIKTIKLVYENNIKNYGVLTCYLCLKPIEDGFDSLEHKIPLSRGGTNEYNNLEVAHISCNVRKRTKTECEYREAINE